MSEGHVTIDEWADKRPLFRDNADLAIKYLTDLRGDEAYRLRRHLMICAREEFDGK